MKHRLFVICFLIGFAFVNWVATDVSVAKEWPSQPITILVGWAAGGTTDLISRMLAESLTKGLGVPVVIENKPGAGGVLALGLLSKAKPDGYTLGSLSSVSITEKPFTRKLPYDPVNGFSYICEVFTYEYGFAVRSDARWKTFPEFVEDAKKQPGKITVSISGSAYDIWLAKLERKLPGFKLTRVLFKGGSPAVTALLGGHVDTHFGSSEWKPYVDAGKLRLLACPSKERMKDFPDVPTWLDLGYGVYGISPGAYIAPAGLPENIRGRLEQEFKKAMDYPGLKNVVKQFSLKESFRPGKELYQELMKVYEENKEIIPQLGIVEQD